MLARTQHATLLPCLLCSNPSPLFPFSKGLKPAVKIETTSYHAAEAEAVGDGTGLLLVATTDKACVIGEGLVPPLLLPGSCCAETAKE